MTRKSDRDKIEMRIDQGIFETALGEKGVLGTGLQSGLGITEREKVHALVVLWITTEVKVRDGALACTPHLKQPFTTYSSSFATKVMACRTQVHLHFYERRSARIA